MRLAQMWCWTGVGKNKSQIAMEPKWTLKACRWDPHFGQDFFGQHLGLCCWHSRAIHVDSRTSLGSRACNWSTQRLKGLVVLMDDVWAPSCVFGLSFQKIGCKGKQAVVATTVASCLISVEYGFNPYKSLLFDNLHLSTWFHSFVDMFFLRKRQERQTYIHPQVGFQRSEVTLRFGTEIRHLTCIHKARVSRSTLFQRQSCSCANTRIPVWWLKQPRNSSRLFLKHQLSCTEDVS